MSLRRHEIEPGGWLVSGQAEPDPRLLQHLIDAGYRIVESLPFQSEEEQG